MEPAFLRNYSKVIGGGIFSVDIFKRRQFKGINLIQLNCFYETCIGNSSVTITFSARPFNFATGFNNVSSFQIGFNVVADRWTISSWNRRGRRILSVDAATPSPATATSASLEAGCCFFGAEQRRSSDGPIGYRRRRRNPWRSSRWRRLAVSMEADARSTDARASVAQ